SELSGGEKQILNLAGVMVMQPKVLILDEPTSQLDPITASDFLATIKKINNELGVTVIMTEHRLEDVIPMADRLIVMDDGSIIADDLPEKTGLRLRKAAHPMFHAMTSAMQIHAGVDKDSPCPVTIKQGKKWIESFMKDKAVNKEVLIKKNKALLKETAIELKKIWFKYEKDSPDVVKDLTLDIEKGEFYCVLGGNGTGKTTTLSIIGGLLGPYRGKVSINKGLEEKIAMLPQRPQILFVEKTVKEDLYEMFSGANIDVEDKDKRINGIGEMMELEDLLSMHPYDLSGGEQQRAAMAKVLLTEPKVLLLDEPTKGLDSFFKEKLAKIIKVLTSKGITVVMVSHDIEFCAKYGDRCSLMFDGSIITTNSAREFFSGNNFYTTAANRIARGLCPMAVTVEDVIMLCKSS
ncbi:MAG: ATP-binding cassette domain-containing protein, partial [Clostridiales bacterium]|nr:ATP-binding cassette domain-containing protein [Clostridiales bacterium]